jgi:hypothetical protein
LHIIAEVSGAVSALVIAVRVKVGVNWLGSRGQEVGGWDGGRGGTFWEIYNERTIFCEWDKPYLVQKPFRPWTGSLLRQMNLDP